MLRKFKSVLGSALILVAGAAYATSTEDEAKLTEDARRMAVKLLDQIRGEVVREMESSGPLRSIVVCKYSAPELTSVLSRQNGVRLTRVSLKPRNRSIGEPDAWEQQVLLDFERRLSRGEKIEALDHAEVVHEPAGRYFRFMKAIPMGQACVSCHGTNISEATKASLAVEYPYDKAVDFSIGQIRGAVSVKKPL
ncbi:MAG: DUF3365 domain-containing protein [Rhodocyclaceae bacterium]|nr:DUF3365 domain-containing protein [Rhodocyclaceae bacterium]